MKSFQAQTHYEVLEISVGATPAEIRGAHDRLVTLYSDDQVALYGLIDPARAAALRERLKEALEVLTDEQRRDAYDLKIGLPPRLVARPPPPPAPRPAVPQPAASVGTGWGGAIAWVTPTAPAQPASQPSAYTYSVTPTKPVAAPPPVLVVPVPVRILAEPSAPEPRQLALDVAPGVPSWGQRAVPAPSPPPPPAPAPASAQEPPAAALPEPAVEVAPAPPSAATAAPLAAMPAPPSTSPSAPAATTAAPLAATPAAPSATPAAPSAAPAAAASAAPSAPQVAAPPAPPSPAAPAPPSPAAPAPPSPAAPAPVEEVPDVIQPPAPAAPGAVVSDLSPSPAPGAEEPPVPVLSDDVQVSIVPARATPSRDFKVERPRPYEIPEGVEINGDLLKQVRLAKGLSLAQLADRTRIGTKHLENVEADRYDALPAPVYLRGILMSLARELGLDGLRVSKSYLTFVEAHRSKG